MDLKLIRSKFAQLGLYYRSHYFHLVTLLTLPYFIGLLFTYGSFESNSAYASESKPEQDWIYSPLIPSTFSDSDDFWFDTIYFDTIAITLHYNGKTLSALSKSTKVGEILSELNINYSEEDIVIPPLEHYVANQANIRVIDVTSSYLTESEDIPFETVYIDDIGINEGEEIVTQEGKAGVLVRTFLIRFEDGVLVHKEGVGKSITNQPQDRLILIGRKKPIPYIVDDRRCDEWYQIVDQLDIDQYEKDWLKYVMWKESRCNASNNYNPTYKGLFQYHPSTFSAYGGTDIWDGQQQIDVTLRIIRIHYGCNHWNYCPEGYR